jgi:arylformamidase
MKRRDFMRHGACLSAGMLVSAAWAAGPGGEKVYLQYTQAELDDAYSQAKWAPNMGQLLADQAAAGARVRAQFPPRTVSYGSRPAEKLDVFSPPGAGGRLPVMVFIHGGNWRLGSKESMSCLAPVFLKHDALFAAPEFDSLPGNTLAGMVDQCRRAIVWAWKNAAVLGADPDRIYVGGHSAGGHLAAVMLTTDWTRFGAPPDLLKGGLVLSGMCDLEPVVLAAGNRHVKVTPAELIELSPVHRLRTVRCPVIVAWGSGDSPEFRRQGALMAQHLRAAGRLAGTYVLDGVNHFEILDALGSDGSPLALGTLALLR